MTDHIPIDTLAEFHLQHPDDAVYSLMAHLVAVLEAKNNSDLEHMARNISNILGDAESTRILHVICLKSHVDYATLMQNCQTITLMQITPKLLLQLAILPVPFISQKLQIDQYWADQLRTQLHHHFTIDDPIVWLKHLLEQTQHERDHAGQDKEDLLMGRAITGKPADTAEDRRTNKWHHDNQLKPFKNPH